MRFQAFQAFDIGFEFSGIFKKQPSLHNMKFCTEKACFFLLLFYTFPSFHFFFVSLENVNTVKTKEFSFCITNNKDNFLQLTTLTHITHRIFFFFFFFFNNKIITRNLLLNRTFTIFRFANYCVACLLYANFMSIVLLYFFSLVSFILSLEVFHSFYCCVPAPQCALHSAKQKQKCSTWLRLIWKYSVYAHLHFTWMRRKVKREIFFFFFAFLSTSEKIF